MTVQHTLNLPQLNPETTDFYLLVNAAQKLQRAVRAPAHPVAGLVETLQGVERTGNKFSRRQLGAVQVAARQTVAAQIQFPRHAEGHRL